MQPENRSGIFVLGCYDSTKTVYTQQCRALVLVYALFRGQVLEPGKTLGVVGGGFAGLTAALAAAKMGVKVTIFEKAPKLLPLQVDSMTRYLSPHLADWPQPTCLELRANLPILPWSANYANTVTQEMLSNSDLRAHLRSGQILVQCNARIRRVEEDYRRGGQMGLVYVEGSSGALQERFNAVIIAVGYGLESGIVYGVPTPYYWENDSLNQIGRFTEQTPRHILISGRGDGALIDIIRASVDGFEHRQILDILMNNAGDAIAEKFHEIEQEAISRKIQMPDIKYGFFREYKAVSDRFGWLNLVYDKRAAHNKVWFNFSDASRFSIDSALINRTIVHLLCEAEVVTPVMGKLEPEMIERMEDGRTRILWSKIGEPDHDYDTVILRHGAPEDYFRESFPELADDCEVMRGKLRELDLAGVLPDHVRQFFS